MNCGILCHQSWHRNRNLNKFYIAQWKLGIQEMHLLKFSWCLAYTISGFNRQEHLTKQTEIFVKSDCFLSGHSDLFIWNAQFLWFCFCAIVVSWCWCIALFWSESNSSKFIPTWARVKTNLFFVQIVAVLFLIASWRSQYLLFPIFLKVLLSWDTKHSFGLKVFFCFFESLQYLISHIFWNVLQTSVNTLNLFVPFFCGLPYFESFAFLWNTKGSFGLKAFFRLFGTKHGLNIIKSIYFIIKQVMLQILSICWLLVLCLCYSFNDVHVDLKIHMIIRCRMKLKFFG